jgi:sulfonate transport system permease protein
MRAALRRLVLPLLLLALWQVAAIRGWADPRLLPPPAEVAAAAWAQLTGVTLLPNLLASLQRALGGFAVGAGLGLALGFLCGLSRLFDLLLRPSFQALKSIAVFAWIPLIAIWFGFGETSRIVFIALAVFPVVVLNTWEGVRAAPAALLEVGAALRFTRLQRLRRILLPAALPSLLTGLQLGLIHAWLATVGAEYFLAKGSGLGGILIEGRDRFDMALVLLGVVLLGGIGVGLNWLAVAGGSLLLPWRRAAH